MIRRNFGLIIIGYGLISLGMMFVLLFIQTSGIAWLIFGAVSLVGAIWIIRKERKDRKTDMIQSELSDMAFTQCPACNQMRFDKKANRCNECGYQI